MSKSSDRYRSEWDQHFLADASWTDQFALYEEGPAIGVVRVLELRAPEGAVTSRGGFVPEDTPVSVCFEVVAAARICGETFFNVGQEFTVKQTGQGAMWQLRRLSASGILEATALAEAIRGPLDWVLRSEQAPRPAGMH
jgi:hypothetical protein